MAYWRTLSQKGRDLGRGSAPSPPQIFLDLKVKMAYFCRLCAKLRFFYDHNSIEIHQQFKKTAMEIALHVIKSVIQGCLSS